MTSLSSAPSLRCCPLALHYHARILVRNRTTGYDHEEERRSAKEKLLYNKASTIATPDVLRAAGRGGVGRGSVGSTAMSREEHVASKRPQRLQQDTKLKQKRCEGEKGVKRINNNRAVTSIALYLDSSSRGRFVPAEALSAPEGG